MLSSLYFAIPIHLTPRGVEAILSKIHELEYSCTPIGNAISGLLARFLKRAGQIRDSELGSDDEDEGLFDNCEFGSLTGLCHQRNGAGDLVPLTETEKQDMHRFALPNDIASMPFTAIWDRLEEASTGVWQWSLRDMLRQYGTVGETLKMLAQETKTTMVPNVQAQVVYIGADSQAAIKEALRKLNILEKDKYPSQSPINIIQPPNAKRYELAFESLDSLGLANSMFFNPGKESIEDVSAQVSTSYRISVIYGGVNDNSLVLRRPVSSEARLDIESIPLRTFSCNEYGTELEDCLGRLAWDDNTSQVKPKKKSLKSMPKKSTIDNVIFEPAAFSAGRLSLDGPESYGTPGLLTPIDALACVQSQELFCTSLLKNAYVTLDRARLWRGEVSLKINFGRFMVRSDSEIFNGIEPLEVEKPVGFRPDDFAMFLNSPDSPSRPIVAFSPIMTTVGQEIQVFEKDIAAFGFKFKSSITCLDFSCVSCDEEFLVSFRADLDFRSSMRFAPSRAELGRINIHCPESLNDMCLTVSVSDPDILRAKYSDFLKFLKSRTLVRVDRSQPSRIAVLYPNLDGASVQISGLAICTTHTYEDSAKSHRVEVRSYQAFSNELVKDNTMVLAKIYHDKTKTATNNGLPKKWHEISLSTNATNEAFKKNRKLALGEYSAWTAEKLDVDEAIDRFIKLGLKMVPVTDHMNHIKWSNK
ncbi:hypothetical protein Cpir12675_005394 [Ceratocystis pirilliformis]|uniref:Uncharacterized protein n=1 Tax=Ceratocystis pirilliformis TaxID=259994 RepID=A0ABR3YQ18_9PEZI